MRGSGQSLPLDLGSIASRCKGSYYAPRRFAAVQLAFEEPKCRVLVFRAPLLVLNSRRLLPHIWPKFPTVFCYVRVFMARVLTSQIRDGLSEQVRLAAYARRSFLPASAAPFLRAWPYAQALGARPLRASPSREPSASSPIRRRCSCTCATSPCARAHA